MSLQAKTIFNLLAGIAAGVLGWVLTDLTGWFPWLSNAHTLVNTGTAAYLGYLMYGALFGLVLGLLLATVDAMGLDSKSQATTTLVIGGVTGFFGGGIGLSMGQAVYGWFMGSAGYSGPESPGHFIGDMFARALGWGIIGAVVGAAQGAGRRSFKVALQGMFGGAVGGLLGGVVFKVAAVLLNNPVPARLAALVAIGALVGFFIGLVQDIFKQAWIKVMVGRNEGKEYLISKSITAIGRSELSDIGLYGDPAIAPTHAVIEALPDQNRHRLRNVAAPQFSPTLVNGQPVTAEQWLTDGDTIQIARRQLLFQEKSTRRAPGLAPAAPVRQGDWPPAPAPSRVQQVPSDAMAPAGGYAPGAPPPPTYMPPAAPTYMPPVSPDAMPSIVRPTQYKPLEAAPPGAPPVGQSDVTVQMTADGDLGLSGTRLSCTAGPYTGQTFLLSHTPVTIGRSADRLISLAADSSVSRTHAIVAYERGRHIVTDDGSANGTKVNGQIISGPRPLRAGDRIQLGETVLVYE